jgi:Ca2+-binding EF-hand superfamily protein
LFKEWDTNKDGRISRDEFVKGSMRQFMILDKNHDGFIDRNEFDRKRIEEGARKNELMTTPFIIFSF